jgi:serine protease inhibitor
MFTEKADFSNLSEQPLFVSSAIQDAKIEVTEEGTEASAATAVSIGEPCHLAAIFYFVCTWPRLLQLFS